MSSQLSAKRVVDWDEYQIGDICQVDWGNTKLTKKSFVEGGEFLGVSAAGCDGRIGHAEHSKFTPVLSAIGARCGRMFYPEEDFTAIKNTITLTPNLEFVTHKFLYYLLTSVKLPQRGAGQPFISKGDIQKFPISIPPLEEQRRIVSILDEAFENISETISQTKNSLSQINDLNEQMLNQIFENSNGEWDEKTLDNICTVKRGSSPRPIKSYLTEDPNGVSWIKIGDTKGIDKYITKTQQKITKEGADRSRLVNKGDLILSNSMSYGKPFIMGISGYIHDGWFVLYVNKEVDSEFLFYALSSRLVQSQFSNLAAGSVVKNIRGDLVKKAVIPIPSLSEQKQIVEDIKSITPSIRLLTSISNAKLESLDELKQAILQEAFNGTL